MPPGALAVRLADQDVWLLPGRAAYLPQQGCLLVADVHIGKAHSFRRLGVPVPAGTTADTLQRLDALIDATAAAEVVVLGDLLHAPRVQRADAARAFAAWRERRPALSLTLVRGNHDRRAGDVPADWRLQVRDGPVWRGGVALVHEPAPVAGGYALAGHLHPALVLGGRAHERLRLPCFHLGAHVGVLPAFGAFTGSHAVRPAPGDRVYVVDGERVQAWPPVPA